MKKGRPIEYLSPSQAIDFAAEEYKIFLSIPSIIKWASKYKYGHQLGGKGGKWVINKTKFKNFLNNENKDD